MSNIEDRKTLNEVLPNLRVDGGFFREIGDYSFIDSQNLAIFYSVRSGDKKISSFLDYYVVDDLINTQKQDEFWLILKNIYGNKWDRYAQVLNKEYEFLDNLETSETITRNTEDDTQDNMNFGERKMTFDKGVETIENEMGQRETNTLNKTNGFDGGLVDSDSTNVTNSDYVDTTTTSSDVDTTTNNSYLDTKESFKTIQENITNTKKGRDGNLQDKILQELEIRKIDFIEMMFKDIDSYLVLKCY